MLSELQRQRRHAATHGDDGQIGGSRVGGREGDSIQAEVEQLRCHAAANVAIVREASQWGDVAYRRLVAGEKGRGAARDDQGIGIAPQEVLA